MFSSVNEFEKNRLQVFNDENFKAILDGIAETRDFVNELGYLSFGRNFNILRHVGIVNGNIILDSAARTLESIRYCCMNANIADAYSLLRKYRDDLFYYLYLQTVTDKNDILQPVKLENLTKDEKNIWDWLHNQQKDLHIGSVLKCIADEPSAREAIQQYGLKESFDKVAKKLNNYVHSNGFSFYNRSFDTMHMIGKLKEKCNEFYKTLEFITMSFLFLLIFINPISAMSTDYTDYLDCDDTPPKGSEYWVAPFISDYLNQHKNVLDAKCGCYLKEKTGMQF